LLALSKIEVGKENFLINSETLEEALKYEPFLLLRFDLTDSLFSAILKMLSE